MASINNIIANGTTVITKIGKLEALVVGICVRGENNEHVQYQISRFANGDNKIDWVEAFEISIKKDNSQPAGFRTNTQQLID